MKDETKIWFDRKGKGHVFDDEYSVTIHHDTEEEMNRTVEFLKHRAFWTPAAEAPKKDGRYLVTMAGWIIDCREPFVEMAEYQDGEWSLEEEAILAWAPLPEPCGRGRE